MYICMYVYCVYTRSQLEYLQTNSSLVCHQPPRSPSSWHRPPRHPVPAWGHRFQQVCVAKPGEILNQWNFQKKNDDKMLICQGYVGFMLG